LREPRILEGNRMTTKRLGIVMHGVTGRMGMNQHLIRSIAAIRRDGGVALANGERVMPDPILVGRNAAKIEELARAHGVERWTTDLDAALANPEDTVFFDAATTEMRPKLLSKAIQAQKHVYCEKPVATNLQEALDIARQAKAAGIKHGVVQDKLFLPGLRKLKLLVDSGFFGRLLSVRGEFGYWVFEGDLQPIQRPSWNYRAEDGGGIILDMICHWRYVLDNTFGNVRSVSCLGATHIPERWDEAGKKYQATADDAAYATFELDGGVVAQVNSSWTTRVRRDDLVTFHVDGTHGSAVAGLTEVVTQSRVNTPRPVWNPDVKQPIDFFAGWQPVPEYSSFGNGFRIQWEAFIRHVVSDEPFKWDLVEGAKGVQLVECALKSWKERRWIDVPALAV
jgi:predicted dehydrogenase